MVRLPLIALLPPSIWNSDSAVSPYPRGHMGSSLYGPQGSIFNELGGSGPSANDAQIPEFFEKAYMVTRETKS
jgi:hypothetical protein